MSVLAFYLHLNHLLLNTLFQRRVWMPLVSSGLSVEKPHSEMC